MKFTLKNISLRSLSFFLCLQMFSISVGKTSWVSDIFASSQQDGAHPVESGSSTARTSDSNTDADDSIPNSSIPDQENECSEVADYFCVESDCLVPENFISAVRQKMVVLADASLKTRISDITPPPPKPCFV
jgi:hypothetical protein